MSGPPPAFELNLGSLFGGWRQNAGDAERDAAGLPYVPADVIANLRTEYEQAAQLGGQAATEKCFNLAWALVHSHSKTDIGVGLELLQALLSAEGTDKRELRYLTAVGQYRLRRELEARRTLKAVLEEHPDFRQAETLLEACEREIVKDGLVGVGAGVAVLGVVAAIAAAALKKK